MVVKFINSWSKSLLTIPILQKMLMDNIAAGRVRPSSEIAKQDAVF